LKRLTNFYLTGNTSSVLVMTKYWKVKPDLFKKNIIDLYSQEPTSLTRILAFVHELKVIFMFIGLLYCNEIKSIVEYRFFLLSLTSSLSYLLSIWLL
jgi:hypothetical protein